MAKKNVTTISVKKDVKEVLDKLRGDRSWDEFLLYLANLEEDIRRREALKGLREGAKNRDHGFKESKIRLRLRDEDTS